MKWKFFHTSIFLMAGCSGELRNSVTSIDPGMNYFFIEVFQCYFPIPNRYALKINRSEFEFSVRNDYQDVVSTGRIRVGNLEKTELASNFVEEVVLKDEKFTLGKITNKDIGAFLSHYLTSENYGILFNDREISTTEIISMISYCREHPKKSLEFPEIRGAQ